MPSMSFLILHGWQGSGPGHWQTWLAGRLRDRGERVSYPELPEHPDHALFFKFVDPSEAEGERYEVYERALATMPQEEHTATVGAN